MKDGKPLHLVLALFGKDSSVYEKLQDDLKRAGVEVELKRVQGPDELLTLAPNGFDMGETNWVTMSTNDPYWFLSLAFKSGAKSNRGDYSNPKVDELIDKMTTTFNEEERTAIVKDIQTVLLEDNAGYFLYYPSANVVTTKRVKNVKVFPIDYYVITKDTTVE